MVLPLKRVFGLLCALCLALALAGCGDGVNSFTWFVDEIPANLDPQVASGSADVIACTNLYAGLLRKTADGTLEYACAERYEVSADGLRYTFYLKDGLRYTARRGAATDYAITAEDFVFAFRRIYSAATASPYTDDFSALANSAAVLAGDADAGELGIAAPDRLTVVFTLSRKDDAFLEKLTLPGAAPCDQIFFESTQGTYGLTMASTLASGSFYVQNWTESGLFLRRAVSGDLVDSLRLVQSSDTTGMSAARQISEGLCSAALDDSGEATGLPAVEYTDTTWCLLFNQHSAVLADEHVRAALANVAYAAGLPGQASARFGAVEGLIPAGVTVDGADYRSHAGTVLPVVGSAKEAYALALAQPDPPRVAGLTLLVPEGSDVAALAQTLNGLWQKELALFFSIETVPADELEQRLAAGKYTLALAPLRLTRDDPLALLARFESGGFTGYSSAEYDSLCRQAADASGSERLALCAQAERLLLQDYGAVPLFCQVRRLLTSSRVARLRFEPYGPVLDLTDATQTRAS